MPRSVKSKTVFLVSKSTANGGEHQGVLTSFRAAYNWVLFKGSIARPNLTERAALAQLRKEEVAGIWDSDKFDSREAALWGHGAELYWIAEIPVVRSK